MWQQLTIHARSDNTAALEEQLLEFGALSITYIDAEDQAVFQEEPGSTPLWDNTVLMALFEAEQSLAGLLFLLRHNPAVQNADTLAPEILEDQVWERNWMDSFAPMQFGRRLWICPSWKQAPAPEAVTIMLDPGLAFGTGTHNTTAMCLRWLDQAQLKGRTVIDYGCGSGVLAIAAALLAAREVHAVDNDLQAITATRSNADSNGIGPACLGTYLPHQLPAMQVDVLLANILAAPLQQLAPVFAELLKPGGDLVLSGLLASQTEDVQSAYADWVDFQAPVLDGDWACLIGVRKT